MGGKVNHKLISLTLIRENLPDFVFPNGKIMEKLRSRRKESSKTKQDNSQPVDHSIEEREDEENVKAIEESQVVYLNESELSARGIKRNAYQIEEDGNEVPPSASKKFKDELQVGGDDYGMMGVDVQVDESNQ